MDIKEENGMWILECDSSVMEEIEMFIEEFGYNLWEQRDYAWFRVFYIRLGHRVIYLFYCILGALKWPYRRNRGSEELYSSFTFETLVVSTLGTYNITFIASDGEGIPTVINHLAFVAKRSLERAVSYETILIDGRDMCFIKRSLANLVYVPGS